jgi:hypothetical protein
MHWPSVWASEELGSDAATVDFYEGGKGWSHRSEVNYHRALPVHSSKVGYWVTWFIDHFLFIGYMTEPWSLQIVL